MGNVDLKTKIVHFYVQRNSSFSSEGAVIPFELARLNEGKAFNLTSGIFTSPVPGIYHFQFSAVKAFASNYLQISIQVNGAIVGLANTDLNGGRATSISLNAAFRLAANDRVNLRNYGCGELMGDNKNHMTHFSGWLVEEDLAGVTGSDFN